MIQITATLVWRQCVIFAIITTAKVKILIMPGLQEERQKTEAERESWKQSVAYRGRRALVVASNTTHPQNALRPPEARDHGGDGDCDGAKRCGLTLVVVVLMILAMV